MCTPRKAPAYLLATLYALAGLFGHAWHNHGSTPGSDAGNRSVVVAPSACGCGHCCHIAGASIASANRQGVDISVLGLPSQVATDSHECLACGLLAGMSVGYWSPEAALRTLPAFTVDRHPSETVVASTADAVHRPRGPPRAAC